MEFILYITLEKSSIHELEFATNRQYWIKILRFIEMTEAENQGRPLGR